MPYSVKMTPPIGELSHDDHLQEAEKLELEAEADRKESATRVSARTYEYWWVIIFLAAIIVLAVAYFFYVGRLELPRDVESLPLDKLNVVKARWEIRALFGEEWGAFSGVMSGLSLVLVALSLLGQRRELEMNRIELSLQRSELKQARAQAHRQLAEMKLRRISEQKQARYASEPVLFLQRAGVGPNRGSLSLHLDLIHAGTPVWNVRVWSAIAHEGLSTPDWVAVPAPSIVSQQETSLVGSLEAPESIQGSDADQAGKTGLWVAITFQNVAGGHFSSTQYVELPFHIIAIALRDWKSPVQYRSTSFVTLTAGDELDISWPPEVQKLPAYSDQAGSRSPST